MNLKRVDFAQEPDIVPDNDIANMINSLSYLCHKAETAKLDMVSLHLNIAFAELIEYHLTNPKSYQEH